MRKLYLFLMLNLFVFCGFAQDLIITGVVDADLTGGLPKTIELYVVNDIADLSTYGIGSANNGGGTDGVELQLTGSANAGDYIYIASEVEGFTEFFGFAPDMTDSAANINGDDAIELFGNVVLDGDSLTGDVIDTFGDINTDGNGEVWEYADGWAYRIDGTGPDGASFISTNWSYSGAGGLSDETTNATAANPFPIGSYSTEGSTTPELTVVSPNNNAELDPFTTTVDVEFGVMNVDLNIDGNQVNITLNGSLNQDVTSPYTASITAGENTILVELLENNTVVDSETITVTVPEVTEVATIAALRNSELNQYYTLTGEAVITYAQPNFRNQKYFEDDTAAILIDDSDYVLSTDYTTGYGITGLTGELIDFRGTLEFIPLSDPGLSSSDNTLTPQQITAAQLAASPDDYESELVTISSLAFDTTTGTFETGTVYPTTDPTGSLNFRTSFFSANYIGAEVPNTPLDVTGIITENQGDSFLTARDADDLGVNLPTVNFDPTIIYANESDGTTTFTVTLSEASTVDTEVRFSYLLTNAGENNDFDLGPGNERNFQIAAGETSATFDMEIADNDIPNKDYFVAIVLNTPSGLNLGEDTIATVYVLDDEDHVEEAANVLGMTYSNSFEGISGAEIVAHDPASQKLFVSNSGDNAVEILDFSNPTAISSLNTIDFSSYGEEVTSVAVYNGIVAAAAKGADQENGTVVFLDTDGNVLSSVEVGVLPDMVTFTPDGSKVLVANEGEPNDEYTIDPEGTISVIDISAGASTVTAAQVTSLNFNAFDTDIAALRDAGVRIFGPNATVSQDLEPEYITVASDSQTAWVTLQENNAYAVIDLSIPEITNIYSYGYKDHNLEVNALDTSNRLDEIFFSTWNTYGMYQPDGIATFELDGTSYLITANEGDARDYDGFSEEERVEDLELDPEAYPNASFIQLEENLGRLTVTSATGDTDNDGDIDQIYNYGGRSFSIFNLDTNTMVYDSGDWLERIIAADPTYSQIFNATDDENAFKNRSDDKGPEPEAVIVQEIDGELYAFVGLERIGGIAVFNISDPTAPIFESYNNSRDNTVDAEDNLGDLAPEGVIYIAPEDNSTDKGLIVVANEVSTSISVYTLENDLLSTDNLIVANNKLKLYPNPVIGNQVFFETPATYTMFDIQGREVATGKQAAFINVAGFATGIYVVKTIEGYTQKVIIK